MRRLLVSHRVPSSTYRFGILIGLASISAFFIALILAFALIRPTGPPRVPLRLPVQVWISTALLAASSITIESARKELRRARVERYRNALVFTVTLGCGFVLTQGAAWFNVIQQGVALEGNPRGSAFFVFSGLHGAHVIGGLVALMWVLARAKHVSSHDESALRRARVRTSVTAIYWHFMGALWLVLLAFLVSWSGHDVL